jgi:hypothetical protein
LDLVQDSAITSLALLKVFWDAQKSYVENFVPFVCDCLRSAPQNEVSLPALQKSIKNDFGLEIPQGALRTIVEKARRSGLVTIQHGVFQRTARCLESDNLTTIKSEVLRKGAALVQKLSDYAKKHFEIDWTPSQAETALYSYLRERSSGVLQAALSGAKLPKIEQSVTQADFIVNSFILNLFERDPDGFEFLEAVVRGSIIANVLLYPDLDSVGENFDRVEFYFDTRFLLRALGFSGPNLQAPCVELLTLLFTENAALYCFSSTFDEVHRVLDFAARNLRRPPAQREQVGESIDFLVRQGHTASDLELAIASLEQSLGALHIYVKEKPPHRAAIGIDELRLKDILLSETKYATEEALYHDLDAVTSIHRLRRGKPKESLENCDAIFVTTNAPLTRASTRYFREEFGGTNYAPHCIFHHTLTTLVWLKRPMVAPDLPQKIIVADCYAALNPTDSLWRNYVREIDRLQAKGDITADDYYILRYSSEARSALMELTLADTSAFAEGTVEEVLERARTAMRSQLAVELEKERVMRMEAERLARETTAREEMTRKLQLDHLGYVGGIVGRSTARLAGAIMILALEAISKPSVRQS